VLAEMYRRKYPTKQGVKVYGNSPRGTWFVPVTGRNADWKLFDWDTWQVRRSDFDQMLLDEAVARGVTLIPGKAIKPLLRDDGTVWGVQVRMPDGRNQNIESEILLDCSGQATFLANAGVTGPKYLGNYDKQIAIFSQVRGAIRQRWDKRYSSGQHVNFLPKQVPLGVVHPARRRGGDIGVVIPRPTSRRRRRASKTSWSGSLLSYELADASRRSSWWKTST
jgi:hypothetical protein